MIIGKFEVCDLFSPTAANINTVRSPKRKRPQPRIIQPAPEGIDASGLASRVTYVGSPEHKKGPSFAGAPRPRGDATKCDTVLKLAFAGDSTMAATCV